MISQQISQQMFCGDDVPAAVVDLGSSTCRFGTVGQDSPRHVFRSDVGIVEQAPSSSSSSSSSGGRRILCGDSVLRCVSDNVETVSSPFSFTAQGGTVVNWEIVEALLDHGFNTCMRVDPKSNALLLAESHFTSLESKQKLIELCFEKFGAPAAYLSPNAVLSSFSAGRPTSLVVDLGASHTRVSPLVDGYVLRQAEVATRRGGDWLDDIVSAELERGHKQSMRPWFETDGKSYPTPRDSFRQMHVRDVARDVKKWMSFVPYVPVARESRQAFIYETIKLPPYELPDGTALHHFDALCTAPERLFLHDYASVSPSGEWTSAGAHPTRGSKVLDFRKNVNHKMALYMPAHAQPMELDAEQATLPELVMASIMKSDVDARKDILSNVLLVGGGANIDGVSNRLTDAVTAVIPTSMKLKINPQLPSERHHAAWIGGSILGICGSFQQLWISKQEYEEYGINIVQSRLS